MVVATVLGRRVKLSLHASINVHKMAALASGHLGPNVPDLVGLENNSEIVIVTTQSQEEMEQQIVLARFRWKRSANLEIASIL